MKLPMKMQKKIAKIVPGCHNWPKRWRDKKVTGKDAGLGLGSSTSSCSDRPSGPTGDSFWAINGEGGRGDLDFLRNSSMRKKNTQSSRLVSGESVLSSFQGSAGKSCVSRSFGYFPSKKNRQGSPYIVGQRNSSHSSRTGDDVPGVTSRWIKTHDTIFGWMNIIEHPQLTCEFAI